MQNFPSAIFAASGGAGISSISSLPDTSDALLKQMRPNGRSLAVYGVSPDGTKDFTTIRAAVAAATALQSSRRIAEGNPVLTPNYRVDIVVYPGTYVGDLSLGPFLAFYNGGAVGSAKVVQNTSEAVPVLGTLMTNGNLYWEGIDIELAFQAVYIGGNPKYPVHASNVGTSIYANCVINNVGGNFTGTPFGMDGVDGGTTLLYKCELKPGPLNCHGWDYTRVPQTMMYVDCIAQNVVNWNALNNIAVDHLWVKGGSCLGITLEGTASKLHRDPATVVGASGVVSPSTDNNTNWPVPYGGLSAADKAYWGMP